MDESQAKSGIRNRTKAPYEPWHDAEGSDQGSQHERKENRSPGRTRTGEFGHADDDQSVDKHQQQHDASHTPPENSPSDPERFRVCRYHLKVLSNLTRSRDPVKATGAMDWALGQEVEEAESARTVWGSGPSVPDSGSSADWRRASER